MDKIPIFAQDDLSPIAAKYSFSMDSLAFEGDFSTGDLIKFKAELSNVSSSVEKELVIEKLDYLIDSTEYLDAFFELIAGVEENDTPCIYSDSINSLISDGEQIYQDGQEFNDKVILEYSDRGYSPINELYKIEDSIGILDEYKIMLGGLCA